MAEKNSRTKGEALRKKTDNSAKIKELKHELAEQKEEVRIVEKRLKQLTLTLKAETKKQIAIGLLAGFGFLIALVWRDFVQEIANLVVQNSHLQGPATLVKLYVALITTLLAVIGILIISKWNKELPNPIQISQS